MSTRITATRKTASGPNRWLIALAATLAAVFVRWLIDPWLGDALPLVTLFAAVAAAVWFCGTGPALLATVAGYLACHLLFSPPRFEFTTDLPNLLGFVAYLFSCAIIIGFGVAVRGAQRTADERREWFRTTLASIGDAVITTDTRGCIESMNAVAESLTGWSAQAASGRPLDAVFRIVDEASRKPAENPALRALREGLIVGLANHTVLIRPDGSELPIDDSAAPIREDHGRVAGCVVVFRDISERRRQERSHAERLAAARVLAAIVESSDDAIVGKTLDGVIQSWNAAAEQLFGHPAERAIGRHISLIFPPDRLGEEDEIMEQLRAGRRVERFDTVRMRSDGSRVDVSLTISPILDEEGRVVGASKIVRDITARKQAEARILSLVSELSDADRRKDEFLATLAHELRGPLAPLRNSLEILKRSPEEPAVVADVWRIMDRQVSQMRRLIDDLLDVSRITYNLIELRPERVDLGAVLAQGVEACRPIAEGSGHELRLSLPQEPIQVDGDPVRLTQVFANLVDNACKYTDPGGTISIAAERQAGEAVVTVSDTGIGISPELLPRVFDMFTQADRSLERSRGGLGIGLTLVKRLIELHGGRVEASSEGLGRGSRFVARLPAVAAAAPEARPRATRVDGARPPLRVLIVDDSEDSASSLSLLLELAGHTTRLAHDGLAAVEVAEHFLPDLVLLDLGLPRLNGFDACRRIRAQAWGRRMRIVALTGWGQEADRLRSEQAGFDAHLVKPVEHAELAKILDALAEAVDGAATRPSVR